MSRPTIAHIWRFAVKGLDRDELIESDLIAGSGLINDRRWAMHLRDPDAPALSLLETSFDPQSPKWLHKSNFMCAYQSPEFLGQYETTYEDQTDTLTIKRRRTRELLLRARLTDAAECANAERFFSGDDGPVVRLVQATNGVAHHFGNTATGFKHHPSGSVLHLVNAATVTSLGDAAGVELAPSRFRPNLVMHGVPAWSAS